jgi:branched-chain amino acid transport system ATP-binding protein
LLEVKSLTKSFGGLLAVNNLDFCIEKDELLGLIGPNGSGKTTVINMICGFYPPTSGKVIFEGEDITGLPPHRICKKGIARTFQISRLFLKMPVLENVMAGVLFGKKEKKNLKEAEEDAMRALALVRLDDKAHNLALDLTAPEARRLEIARALATRPRLLVLDEAMCGLNPTEVGEMMGHINVIKKTGMTMMIIEHVMKVVMGLSERIIVLNEGTKIAEGTPVEVSKMENVIQAYLGTRFTR